MDGTLHSYFPLAEQFVTQSEPSFCSLSSLSMVLNALNFDPKKIWKGSYVCYPCCRISTRVKAYEQVAILFVHRQGHGAGSTKKHYCATLLKYAVIR